MIKYSKKLKICSCRIGSFCARSETAFTLIELLLGISIFSVMVLSLYSVFSSGIRLDRQTKEVENVYRDARWAVAAIALDLENMVEFDRKIDAKHLHEVVVEESNRVNTGVEVGEMSEEASTSFIGNEKSLFMVVPSSSGLKAVRYFLQEPKRGAIFETVVGNMRVKDQNIIISYDESYEAENFVREVVDISSMKAKDIQTKIDIEVLSKLTKKDSLRFYYAWWKNVGEDREIEWRDSWEENFLPLGVRVEVVFLSVLEEGSHFKITKDMFIPKSIWQTDIH